MILSVTEAFWWMIKNSPLDGCGVALLCPFTDRKDRPVVLLGQREEMNLACRRSWLLWSLLNCDQDCSEKVLGSSKGCVMKSLPKPLPAFSPQAPGAQCLTQRPAQ